MAGSAWRGIRGGGSEGRSNVHDSSTVRGLLGREGTGGAPGGEPARPRLVSLSIKERTMPCAWSFFNLRIHMFEYMFNRKSIRWKSPAQKSAALAKIDDCALAGAVKDNFNNGEVSKTAGEATLLPKPPRVPGERGAFPQAREDKTGLESYLARAQSRFIATQRRFRAGGLLNPKARLKNYSSLWIHRFRFVKSHAIDG